MRVVEPRGNNCGGGSLLLFETHLICSTPETDVPGARLVVASTSFMHTRHAYCSSCEVLEFLEFQVGWYFG